MDDDLPFLDELPFHRGFQEPKAARVGSKRGAAPSASTGCSSSYFASRAIMPQHAVVLWPSTTVSPPNYTFLSAVQGDRSLVAAPASLLYPYYLAAPCRQQPSATPESGQMCPPSPLSDRASLVRAISKLRLASSCAGLISPCIDEPGSPRAGVISSGQPYFSLARIRRHSTPSLPHSSPVSRTLIAAAAHEETVEFQHDRHTPPSAHVGTQFMRMVEESQLGDKSTKGASQADVFKRDSAKPDDASPQHKPEVLVAGTEPLLARGDEAEPVVSEPLEPDRKRIKTLFNQIDRDKTGAIEKDELVDSLQEQNVYLSEGDIRRIFQLAQAENEGVMTFEEFYRFCKAKEQRLRSVFDAMDRNSDGRLHDYEIRESLRILGIQVTDDELQDMIEHLDSNGDGLVEWHEWREQLYWVPDRHVDDLFRHWQELSQAGSEFVLAEENEDDIDSKLLGKWLKHFIAGGVAGAISRSCTAPLDRLKIILQVEAVGQNYGIVGGVRYMLQEGGARSMWRGNGVNVMKIAPETAIKFWAWEALKELAYPKDGSAVSMDRRLFVGAAAGLTAQISIYPMEVLKTRLAAAKTSQYKGILDCARTVHQQGGVRAFYRGLTPALVGVIPFAGIDFAVYEYLKVSYTFYTGTPANDIVLLACGAVSSSCGQLVSYPLALVRTRLQADSTNTNNFVQELGCVYQQGGVRALYRGISANMLKVAPAVSITYVIFERMKQLLS